MDRIERIMKMEAILDRTRAAFDALSDALEAYKSSLGDFGELRGYYTGGEWIDDHDADDAGLLPQDLKRGVLSEDAVFDLLAEYESLRAELAELSNLPD